MRRTDAEPRPPSTRASTLLGLALVVAALLLALPGVRAVRANDAVPASSASEDAEALRFADTVRATPPVSEVPAAPSCGDGSDPHRSSAATVQNLAGEVERLRAAPQPAGAGEVVVLNNRGYNYRTAPSAEEVERLRATAEAQRAAKP